MFLSTAAFLEGALCVIIPIDPDRKNQRKMELDMSALAGMAGGARPKPPSYEEVMDDLKQKAIIMGVAIFAMRVAPYVINAVQILTNKPGTR